MVPFIYIYIYIYIHTFNPLRVLMTSTISGNLPSVANKYRSYGFLRAYVSMVFLSFFVSSMFVRLRGGSGACSGRARGGKATGPARKVCHLARPGRPLGQLTGNKMIRTTDNFLTTRRSRTLQFCSRAVKYISPPFLEKML